MLGAGEGAEPGAGAYLFDGAAVEVEGGGWNGDAPRWIGGPLGVGNVELAAGGGGAYASAAADVGLWNGAWTGGDRTLGVSPAFGGGGRGGVGLLKCETPGGGGDIIDCEAFGNGEAIGCCDGVPRRDVGSRVLRKLSGMSFQLVIGLAAADGVGAAEGEVVPARGGGGRGADC